MRAEKLHQEVLISCVDFQSNIGFLCIGGDEISADSSPRSLVHRDHAKLLIMVNMLTHKKRNRINKHLKMRYGRLFVTLPDIHFPDHYTNDRVHLNT